MLENYPRSDFAFLDEEQDRKQIIADIRQVREDVFALIQAIPEGQWHEPRYHGWTPAAMLGHLNLMDSLSLLLIKASLLGFRPQLSRIALNRLNNFTVRIFARRLIPPTIQSVRRKQAAIEDFILKLPVDRFSRQVYDPTRQQLLTVEHALQSLFLHHWQDHLRTMREVEGIEQPPEERSDSAP